jgi:DNA-binding transcriptional MerR regulator
VAGSSPKASGAFRTIGELSRDTGIAQHILRYWETRFPELRPVTRAGNRRYYRPEDVALVRRIDSLLNKEGYSFRGAQQLIAGEPATAASAAALSPLVAIRDSLARALAED